MVMIRDRLRTNSNPLLRKRGRELKMLEYTSILIDAGNCINCFNMNVPTYIYICPQPSNVLQVYFQAGRPGRVERPGHLK